MLRAYLDESGRSADARIVSLAAFVAPTDVWGSFDNSWRVVLGEHSAPYLHMREFAHWRGAFEGWEEARRRSLLAALMQTIRTHELVAVGAAIDVAGFESLSARARASLIDPFFCCVQEVAFGLALRGDGRGGCEAIFSRQDEFAHRAKMLWEHMRMNPGTAGLNAITFDDMRETPALQAADLIAYELRHFYDRRIVEPTSAPRWPFAQLVEDQVSRGNRLLKFLPPWYLELQASADFEREMARLCSTQEGLERLQTELWPQL